MDLHFENQGYERISLDRVTELDAPTHKGIDGVYFKPDGNLPYIIAEAKYDSARLGKTLDGPQMSYEWITGSQRLEKAVGIEKADEILCSGFDSVLFRVNKDGSVITKLLD